jgi:hypothetical protein
MATVMFHTFSSEVGVEIPGTWWFSQTRMADKAPKHFPKQQM